MAYDDRETLRQIYQREETTASKFIPAKPKIDIHGDRLFRVCAYCRVSTDNNEQLSSFELQQQHYKQLIGNHANWDLKRIYADESISGTSLKNRDDFNEMIAACERGEYDLIVTKSVSRFARNLVDCISLVRKLKRMNPPVGVYFETDNREQALFRIDHLSWWKEEMPSEEEMAEGLKNLEKAGNKVDCIISHCAPTSIQDVFSRGVYEHDTLTDYFEKIRRLCNFKLWFFGHYHDDKMIGQKYIMLYGMIVSLDDYLNQENSFGVCLE